MKEKGRWRRFFSIYGFVSCFKLRLFYFVFGMLCFLFIFFRFIGFFVLFRGYRYKGRFFLENVVYFFRSFYVG